jgi:hypothetical protein
MVTIKSIVVYFLTCSLLFAGPSSLAQLKWENVDSLFAPLPKSVHVYLTREKVDTGNFRAYYLIADLQDKHLDFTTDTSYKRRLTPSVFYQKNNQPLVVVNASFFSFTTHQNLDLVIRKGELLGYNLHSVPGKGKDTLTYRHPLESAFGIDRKRRADVAWTYTDSGHRFAYVAPFPPRPLRDSSRQLRFSTARSQQFGNAGGPVNHAGEWSLKKWKMESAVGGGPVLLQNGEIAITNEEELKFAGRAIHDKHPRTAMGYTRDNKLIILVIQGRSESSGGATLGQEAQILKDLGCLEALNLDGGGSSCLLVNGKETIKPSDKEGQRAVPGVFLIQVKD